MTSFRILDLRIGRPQAFGPQGQLSAIVKQSAPGPLFASATGLEGDEQGDTKHHGGRDKAIHAYPAAHYAAWAAEYPATGFLPGSFGENLMVDTVAEADICLGDHWQIGAALCEVSQGRQPCWKLNIRFGMADMALRVQRSGRTGWYFRVLEPGFIAAGNGASLVARPHPEWPLNRVTELLYGKAIDLTALAEFAALPILPESWHRLALRRIENNAVEDWGLRVTTPA